MKPTIIVIEGKHYRWRDLLQMDLQEGTCDQRQ